MEYVNTFSEFNRLSIKKKFSRILRAYYLLRHHNSENHSGSGWLPYPEVKDVMGNYWTENSVRDILILGNGIFWQESGLGIVIFKVERLGKAINCLPGHRVEIPLEAFSSLMKFRAFAYATYFAKSSCEYGNDRGKNISRQVITKLFGISDTTQKRYEEIAAIKVENQYGLKKIPVFNPSTMRHENEEEFRKHIEDKLKPGSWLWDADEDGKPEIVQQLSNNYYVDTVIYKTNENKRVRNIGGDDHRYVAKPRLKLYHEHIKPLQKMVKKSNYQQEGYLHDKDISNKRRGRFHWIRKY